MTLLRRLAAARTNAERADRLRAEGLADESGLSWLMDQVDELLHDDPPLAEAIAECCGTVAAEDGRLDVAARSDYARARVWAERGSLDGALVLIDSARERWTRAGQPLSALRTGLGRMQILDDLGRHAEAVSVGEQLLQQLEAAPDRGGDPRTYAGIRAAIDGNIGVALSFIGDHRRSVAAYRRAEATYRELGLAVPVAQQQANRGIELVALGRARAAVEVLTAATRSFATAGDRLWSAKSGVHLAEAHRQVGDLVEALRVLEGARDELALLGATAEEARASAAVGRVCLTAGLFGEALVDTDRAIQRFADAQMRHDQAVALLTRAEIGLATGRLDSADRDLMSATDRFVEVDDRQSQARAALIRAEVLAGQDRPEQARAELDRAGELLAAGGWLVPACWARLRRAQLTLDPTDRRRRLEALADPLADLGLPDLDYAYALARAQQLREAGEVDRQVEALRAAVDIVDDWGTQLTEPLVQVAVRGRRFEAHDQLVLALVRRNGTGDATEALAVSDAAKSGTLRALVTGTVGRIPACAGTTAERELADRIADLGAAYARLGEVELHRRPALRQQIEELEAAVSAARLRARAGAPLATAAAELSRESARPDRSPGLAFHVVDDDIVVFVVDRDRTSAVVGTGLRLPVEDAVRRLVAQWNRFRLGSAFIVRHHDRLEDSARRILAELYDLLVAPVRAELEGIGTDEIVIAPHRSLHQIPFQALHDGHHWLIDRWTIRTCATSTAAPLPPDGAALSQLLVLAVPDAAAPGIAAEAAALAEAIPTAVVRTGARATAAVLRADLPGPAHLHLACHGMYRPGNPLFSALRLADGWFSVADVLDLDLAGAAVTLSACESGRPSEDTAEPIGLAWAFLSAGAEQVVVSQWVVDDLVVGDTMRDLYAELARGRPLAVALRSAQRRVARSHPHPYYWAPFACVTAGDMSHHRPRRPARSELRESETS